MKKRLRLKKRYAVCFLLLLLWIWAIGTGKGKPVENVENTENDFLQKGFASAVAEGITKSILSISCRKDIEVQNGGNGTEIFLKEFPIMVQAVPVGSEYPYGKEKDYEAAETTEKVSKEISEGKTLEEPVLAENGKQEDILAGMLAENQGVERGQSEAEASERKEAEDSKIQEGSKTQEGFLQENMAAIENSGETTASFQKHQKINSFDFEALEEYQTLVSTFYTIDAGTTAGSNQLNLEKLLSKDMRISKEDPGPQILIYHTHSTEGFADSLPGDKSQTVVGVGEHLAEILTKEYGYRVLHHTEEYDTVRDDAYAKALPGLQKVLEENPQIQVVIDLHRDAGVKGVHRAINLDGKSTATFMLFNGLSRTKKTGDISYLYNPYQEDNLAFSFQMQVKAGEYYPGLTRKIYLKGYRYNMHLIPKTLLIELGDSNNTLEEAMNTCEPLAHILDMVLSGQE